MKEKFEVTKWALRSFNRRRIDSSMDKGKRTKRQTMVERALHRKLKIDHY